MADLKNFPWVFSKPLLSVKSKCELKLFLEENNVMELCGNYLFESYKKKKQKTIYPPMETTNFLYVVQHALKKDRLTVAQRKNLSKYGIPTQKKMQVCKINKLHLYYLTFNSFK